MRRRRPELEGVPRELRVFIAADWPAKNVAASFAQWRSARLEFSMAHRNDLNPLDALLGAREARPWAARQ